MLIRSSRCRFPEKTPTKRKACAQHLYNAVPTSSTLAQHYTNAKQMFCVYWDYIITADSLTQVNSA